MPESKPKLTFEQTVIHDCEGYISNAWISEILKAHEDELARVHEQYKPLVELCEQRVKDDCSWCETKDVSCETCFENKFKSALEKAKGGMMKCPICGSEMEVDENENSALCENEACAFYVQSESMDWLKTTAQKLAAEKEQSAEKRGSERERARAKPLVELLKRVWPIVKCRNPDGRRLCKSCEFLKGCFGGVFNTTLKAYEEGSNA